jgi:hypothetical protein
MVNKILITIPTCEVEGHNLNWKESRDTWVIEAKNKGYDVIFTKPSTSIPSKKHIIKDGFLFSKSKDIWDDLFRKRVLSVCNWIKDFNIEQYDWIFFIDSDTFVNIEKFDKEIPKILNEYPGVDYMGCANPYEGWYPHSPFYKFIYKEKTFASGFGFMLSKKACRILAQKYKDEDYSYITLGRDDVIVGDLMYKNGIPLLHNNSFSKESKWRKKLIDPQSIGTPHIGDSNSHVYVQHYINGHMKEIQNELKS